MSCLQCIWNCEHVSCQEIQNQCLFLSVCLGGKEVPIQKARTQWHIIIWFESNHAYFWPQNKQASLLPSVDETWMLIFQILNRYNNHQWYLRAEIDFLSVYCLKQTKLLFVYFLWLPHCSIYNCFYCSKFSCLSIINKLWHKKLKWPFDCSLWWCLLFCSLGSVCRTH